MNPRISKRKKEERRDTGENGEDDDEPRVTVTFGDHDISFPIEYPFISGSGKGDDKPRLMCLTVNGEILAAQRVIPA